MQNTMAGGKQPRGSYRDLCICVWITMFIVLSYQKVSLMIITFFRVSSEINNLKMQVIKNQALKIHNAVQKMTRSSRENRSAWNGDQYQDYILVFPKEKLQTTLCKYNCGSVKTRIMKNGCNISVYATLQVWICQLVFHSVVTLFFVIYFFHLIFSPYLLFVDATLNNCKISWSHRYTYNLGSL